MFTFGNKSSQFYIILCMKDNSHRTRKFLKIYKKIDREVCHFKIKNILLILRYAALKQIKIFINHLQVWRLEKIFILRYAALKQKKSIYYLEVCSFETNKNITHFEVCRLEKKFTHLEVFRLEKILLILRYVTLK
jgi:hypothetical protein